MRVEMGRERQHKSQVRFAKIENKLVERLIRDDRQAGLRFEINNHSIFIS